MEVHLTERELTALTEGRIVTREGRAAGYEWTEGVQIVPPGYGASDCLGSHVGASWCPAHGDIPRDESGRLDDED